MNPKRTATPRRILFVNHVAGVSGAELSLLGLLTRIDRRRFFPLVACPEGPLAARIRELKLPHLPVRLGRIYRPGSVDDFARGTIQVIVGAFHLRRLIRKHRIDLIHANATTAHLYAVFAAKMTGVPVVWHVRDLVELGGFGKLLFRFADAVVAVSDAVNRHVAAYADDLDKLWTVTNGIDVEELRRRATPRAGREALGIAEGVPVVTMVAQVTPWKGHATLLAAVGKVLERFPETKVLLVGRAMTPKDEAYARRLRHRVKQAGLERAVRFLGWREDTPSIVADSDVVVLPSRNEPFGRAALEALALGTPVVGTDAGGLPELIRDGETGLLVPVDDAVALADALIELLEDPERRIEMGREGARDAGQFTVERTAAQLQNLYDDLLGTG